jgi:hypothetical protein
MPEQKIHPAQRAAMFKQQTRRNFHPIKSQSVAESNTYRIEIPKSKLLSKLYLRLTGTITATHATETSYVAHEAGVANLINRVQVTSHQGFMPVNAKGRSLRILNQCINGIDAESSSTAAGRYKHIQPVVSSAGGTANSFVTTLEVPIQVNDRDPVGLIMLQNGEVLLTLDVTIGAKGDIAPASSGYTFALSAMTLEVYGDTFSIPADPNARPDLSILKMITEQQETLAATINTIELPIGNTYRRIIMQILDSSDDLISDAVVNGDIELVFQQSDTPLKFDPDMLALENRIQYGGALPAGVFVLDFASNEGLADLASSRDYIDTARVTKFDLKIPTSAAGSVILTMEQLSRIPAL